LQKDYAKSIGITTRQLAHLLQDNNVSFAKLDDFSERDGIDPWELIRPPEGK
ncbi:transcriptional regulator, partial [Lactobacillus rhamnosus]|nr:transcriptional regulator [Lacticaseibacillus rhamnosus]